MKQQRWTRAIPSKACPAIAASIVTPLSLGILAGLVLGLAYGQPRWLFRGVLQFHPGAIFFMATEAPLVALTIDDGPQAGTTAALLDVLAEHQAQATFFVLGEKLPPGGGGEGFDPGELEWVLQRLLAEGHELGNHLYRDAASIALSPAAFEAELWATEQRIAPYGPSAEFQWLRPGRGWYSAEMVAIAQRNGYRMVLGDRFPYDTHLPSPGFATAQILGQIQPGSIIVLHDGPERGQRTVATLRRLLPALQRRGYDVVTLSTMARAAARP